MAQPRSTPYPPSGQLRARFDKPPPRCFGELAIPTLDGEERGLGAGLGDALRSYWPAHAARVAITHLDLQG